jgi:hypothetical protein
MEIGQKRLEPKRAVVFVAVNDFEQHSASGNRGSRPAKMQFHFPTIAAFEWCCNVTFIRQTAPFTKRRLNKPHVLPTTSANVAIRRASPIRPAELTALRIEKA